MRALWLLAPLAGCQLVFPLDDSSTPPFLRASATQSTPADVTTIKLAHPDNADPEDFVVVTIQGHRDNTAVIAAPSVLTKTIDTEAVNCSNGPQWHYWVFTGHLGSPQDSTFTFDSADQFDLAIDVYAHAGSITQTASMPTQQVAMDRPFDVAEAPGVAPASIGWLGIAASASISINPTAFARRASTASMATWDSELAGTSIPAFEVILPADFCGFVGEYKIEPPNPL